MSGPLHSNIRLTKGEPLAFINPFYTQELTDVGVNTAAVDDGENRDTEVNILDFIRVQVLAMLGGEFFASFFGGFIILYTAALAGATTGITYDASALGLGVGLGVFIAVAVFGHVSGGHANPALTLVLYIMNVLHYFRSAPFTVIATRTVLLIMGWVGQFAGWICAAACVYYAVHEGDTDTNIGLPQVNPAGINGDTVHLFRAAFAETIASVVFYSVFAFGIVDRKSLMPSLEMGLAVTGITIALGGHTGGVMNPMRWLCTAIIKSEFNSDWNVYVWPPLVAALLAVVLAEIWRRFIERPSVGYDPSMTSAPQMPPHNKHLEARKEDHKKSGKPESDFTIDSEKYKQQRGASARVFAKTRLH
jgi:glycerol uptake facilitator-like aquaporin